jgi:hypothetical protein
VAVLFIALVLNLLSFALKLFDLFLRSSGQDKEDDFSQQGWSNDAEDNRKGLAS